jgi:DNA-binding FrmR family transcriptional regulator
MHNKQKVSTGLKKVASLVTKIQKMADEDKYCIDVIQQVLAAQGLLRGVTDTLLEGHLRHCFKNAMQSGNSKRQDDMTVELLKVLRTAQKK